MSFPVFIDLFQQLFFIGSGSCRDRFFHLFMDVSVGFDMGAVHENNFRGKIPAFVCLKENPCKDLFDGIFCKTMPEVITDGGKMGNRFVQKIAQEPTIGNVHVDFFYGTPQGRDPVKMLDKHHLKQDNRIYTGASIVCTIKLFHKVIDMGKINGTVNFS